MSRHGDITLPFGAEEQLFRLGIGQVRAIEEKCDAGPPELARRLAPAMRLAQIMAGSDRKLHAQIFQRAVETGQLGSWKMDDYREPIFQGLIGAGIDRAVAGALVMANVDGAAPLSGAITAYQILMAWLLGPEDDPVGEGTGAPATKPATKPRSRAARPASPGSTKSGQSSATRRPKSTA